ncbi:MAG TPA: hypothetical protein VN476_15120 [Pyrinomonadaceae bacterium]|nr:hypothetical protein [Pyrinomonadaceae bacterium]
MSELAGAPAPVVRQLVGNLPARAAGADGSEPIGRVPFDGTITGVTFIGRGTLTGADTDTRTLSVVNKAQNGAGATTVASLGFVNGVNAPAFDEKPVTLSGTAANLNVSEGDVLVASSAHSGSTGLADPGGLVVVTIARRPTAA